MSCRGMGDLFQDALDGALAGSARDRWEKHLAQCARCRTDFEASRRMATRLGGLPQEELPPFFRARLLAQLERPGTSVERTHRFAPHRSLRLAWGTVTVLALALAGTVFWFRGGWEGSHRSQAPQPSFSQAQVSGGLSADDVRMAALRAGIQPVSPLDDSFVNAQGLAVCAALSSALPPATFRLLVDGRDVTALADITPDYIIFAPEESLGDGPHLVTVELRTATECVERSWVFYALGREGRQAMPETRDRTTDEGPPPSGA